jgi:hypothetical protein
MTWSSRNAKNLCGPFLVLLLFLNSIVQKEWEAFHSRSGMEGADLSVYYVAGKIALGNGDRRLYYYPSGPVEPKLSQELFLGYVPRDTPWQKIAHESGLNDVQPYTYPPFFAILFAPFTLLKPHTAVFLWRGSSLVLVLLSVLLALRIADVRPFVTVFCFCAVGSLSFFPVLDMLYLAQVGSLILFLWTLGAYCLARDRPISSGLVFAIGTLVKLTPAVVVPIFLFRKRWRWLAGYAAGLVILTALSAWLVGWENYVTYFRKVLPLMSCGVIKLQNKSVSAFVLQLVLGNSYFEGNSVSESLWRLGCGLAKAVDFGIYSGGLFWIWWRRFNLVDGVIIFALISLLVSPVSWRHHYVLAILPLVVLWSKYLMAGGAKEWESFLLLLATLALGAVPLGDILVPSVSSLALRIGLASPMLLGAVIALWLYLRLPQHAWDPLLKGSVSTNN